MDMVPSLCRSNLPSGELHVVRLFIMEAGFTNHFSVVLDRRKVPLRNEHRLRPRPEDFGEPKYTENHQSWVIRSLYDHYEFIHIWSAERENMHCFSANGATSHSCDC